MPRRCRDRFRKGPFWPRGGLGEAWGGLGKPWGGLGEAWGRLGRAWAVWVDGGGAWLVATKRFGPKVRNCRKIEGRRKGVLAPKPPPSPGLSPPPLALW